MRIVITVAACALLAACGGSRASQANNAQVGISNDSGSATQASNLQFRLSLGDATKIMHTRHEGMEKIGKDFKVLHREFDTPSPDLALVRTAAAEIAGLSRNASGWFPAGTGPEVGKTGAKPEIWADPHDFSQKLGAFQHAAATFNVSTTKDNVEAMKARYADLGGTCKACHDKYRAEMHH